MDVGEPRGSVGDRERDEASDTAAVWGTRWKFSRAWASTAAVIYIVLVVSVVLLDGREQLIAFGLFLMLQGVHVLYWKEPWAKVAGFMRCPPIGMTLSAVAAILVGAAFVLGVLA